ncbi:MAG: response regulator [Woeseiaceae bacterium]
MLPAHASSTESGGRHPLHASGAGDSLSPGRRTLRILVADDEPDTVATLTVLLEEEGHEVIGVHDGGDVLREARKSPPDAVILDIGMPGLNGYDVARALRAMFGKACPTLIAVTAYATAPDKLVGKDAGFHHHFGKPVVLHELLAALSGVKPQG